MHVDMTVDAARVGACATKARKLGTARLFADVAVDGGSFAAFAVGFLGHGVDAGGVDPTVIEIEEGADGDGVVYGVVGPTYFVKGLHVVGAHGGGIVVDLPDEAQQGFLFLGESGGFQVAEYALDQLFTAQQFSRNCGVGLQSKGAIVLVRSIGGD